MLVVSMCCAAGSAWLLTAPVRRAGRHCLSDSPPRAGGTTRGERLVERPRARACLCAGALSLLGWVLLGPVGGPAGMVAGLGASWWIGRLEPPAVARAREEIGRDLPLAVDLLAACSSVGRPTEESLAVVSRAVGGALAERIDDIIARLSLGADPFAEWSRLAVDPLLGPLGRTMQRSTESGAPLVEALSRLAEDRRRERRTQTQLRARSVGVKAAGPLAACFLPAFMLVGVVPTVAGGFQHLFG
ncbi:MAG: hypothetical protein QOI51_2363 [Nocardioidaceae bacterium]|nr:hypothetical protein [Nocardioidaceae bacterium]